MPRKKEDPITPSDWITFLQGEISSTTSFILPIVTIILITYIALIQINQQNGSELFPTTVEEITGALLFLVFVGFALLLADLRPKLKLSRRIMKRELKTHDEILKVYVDKVEKNWIHGRKRQKKEKTKKTKGKNNKS